MWTSPAGRNLELSLLAAGAAALALLGATCVAPAGAQALAVGTYFVSPTGSDGADGSVQTPWRTIQKATSTAPAGATILVAGGSYQPFTVTQPGQTIASEPGDQVVVHGRDGVRDVVLVAASAVTVSGLTVTGCVPNPSPGRFEDDGSSDVRIDDGTTGVVLHGLTVTSSRGTNSYGLPFGCYGVFAHHADAFRIIGNDISGTGLGVYVNGGGQQGIVAQNEVHDNNVVIRNTPGGDDDYGADGIMFSEVSATPGVLATHNDVYDNAGPSSDYGTDGGGFEVFDASNTQIVANTISNNDDVLETGASPNGGSCHNNLFTGNTASGRSTGSTLTKSIGLILRCATTMVVDHNTFTGIDWWVYDLETNDKFSTNVNGLAITGNTVRQAEPVYRLRLDPVAANLVVEGNRFATTGPYFAVYDDGTYSTTLADWQQRTGQDGASLTF